MVFFLCTNAPLFTLVGLFFDFIGFSIIFFEAWKSLSPSGSMPFLRHEDARRLGAIWRAETANVTQGKDESQVHKDIYEDEFEHLELDTRRRFLGYGAISVLAGFFLQIVGAWPC